MCMCWFYKGAIHVLGWLSCSSLIYRLNYTGSLLNYWTWKKKAKQFQNLIRKDYNGRISEVCAYWQRWSKFIKFSVNSDNDTINCTTVCNFIHHNDERPTALTGIQLSFSRHPTGLSASNNYSVGKSQSHGESSSPSWCRAPTWHYAICDLSWGALPDRKWESLRQRTAFTPLTHLFQHEQSFLSAQPHY